ncbi:MAG: hypothetical protein EOO10_01475 [Chitinophagaceae bacterium]|nr:MAG: hypothetical protein EOO10_01475 [Chitinophagaceae bacterium]
MAIQLFLIFIGSALGCSIVLALVVKSLSEGFAVSGKKPFAYGSVSAILASLLAYLATFIANNPFQTFWILGGIFLLFGAINILFIHNRYFYTYKGNNNKVLIAEIVFGLSIVFFTVAVFSSLQYFLKKELEFLFYPLLMSALLFFVPLLVFHTFQAAFNIPDSYFQVWQYPMHDPIELPEESSKEKKVVIGFELTKKAGDNRKTYFRAIGPETMKLGDLFFHFMNEYNYEHSGAGIEYADSSYEPQEWWFHRKPKWYQWAKIYNPELSIRENGIVENTIVVCERILEPAHPSIKIQQQI